MSEKSPLQLEIDTLEIHDGRDGSKGGPPGWLALGVVAGMFLGAASVLFVLALIAA
ncbi:MAG: hypothetical protein AAFX76_08170 [Planctomycetota bacterium]